MYSFQGLPNEVSWKIMGIPGDRGSLTSTPLNGYSKGLGDQKQRSPPWGNGYFLDPLHITELPILSPVINSVLLVVAVEKGTLLVINQVTSKRRCGLP